MWDREGGGEGMMPLQLNFFFSLYFSFQVLRTLKHPEMNFDYRCSSLKSRSDPGTRSGA